MFYFTFLRSFCLSVLSKYAELALAVLTCSQGRLIHHINDGTKAPSKNKGKVFAAFFKNLRGR